MLSLRPAVPDDEDRLLAWRNEPATRRASITSEEISARDHHLWFVQKLADRDCALLIIEEDGHPVGQVRLDRVGLELAELSIGLDAQARGRGIGRDALRAAALRGSALLGVANIRAIVLQGNQPSLAAFQAAGFRVVGADRTTIELRRPAWE